MMTISFGLFQLGVPMLCNLHASPHYSLKYLSYIDMSDEHEWTHRVSNFIDTGTIWPLASGLGHQFLFKYLTLIG